MNILTDASDTVADATTDAAAAVSVVAAAAPILHIIALASNSDSCVLLIP